MTVYIDQLIITSFCMNLLILLVTKKILRKYVPYIKLCICSLTSVGLTITLFIPHLPFSICIIINTIASACILVLLFKPSGIKAFIRTYIAFNTATFSVAGCSYMIINLFNAQGLFTILFPTVVISYVAISLIGEIYDRCYKTDHLTHRLKICIGDVCAEIACYCDTGNNLVDPISKKPVIVTGVKPIRKLLPEGFVYHILHNGNLPDVYCAYAEALKLKIIPYHTIAGDGILLGILPDSITLDDKEIDAIIGIATNNVFVDDKHIALINPLLIT